MSREETRFTMRIDTGLFAILKVLAKKNKRSTVKEIEHILEEYVISKVTELQAYDAIQTINEFSSDELIRNWHIAHGVPFKSSEVDSSK